MPEILKGKYVGKHRPLWHKTALLMRAQVRPKAVFAQFDDLSLPKMYNHGWRLYPADCFIILGDDKDVFDD